MKVGAFSLVAGISNAAIADTNSSGSEHSVSGVVLWKVLSALASQFAGCALSADST